MKHITIALFAITLAGCQSPPLSPTISELDWGYINIDQPIEQLEYRLEKACATGGQQQLNYTISNIVFLYRIKMKVDFQTYLESLSAHKQSEIISEQKKWLEIQTQKTSDAYEEYAGGTSASYHSGKVAIAGLKERIEEIQTLMDN